jgi:hypothetical protein
MAVDPKKRDGFEYEHHEINWTAGVGQPAGVYWLEGRSVVAGHGSAGEAKLLAAGAVLIATLLFERDPLECGVRGRSVAACPAPRIAGEFFTSGVN